MIGKIDLKETSAHPNMPLDTVCVVQGSAARIGFINVPDAATALSVAVTNVSGVIMSVAAEKIDGIWTVSIPASHFSASGTVADGVVVAASDSTNEWIIGMGDLYVKAATATPSPGTTVTPITDKTLDGETVDTSTLGGLREVVKTIAETMGATVSALAICCSAFGGEVHTAPLADLPIDTAQVVTGVTFGAEGGITTNDVCGIVTNETADWQFTFTGFDSMPTAARVVYVANAPFSHLEGWQLTLYDSQGAKMGGYSEEFGDTALYEDESATTLYFPQLYSDSGGMATMNGTVLAQKVLRNALGLARLADLGAITNGLPERIAANATTNATQQSAISAQSSRIAALNSTVSSWETYWDGDEVRVTVTNYDSQVHMPAYYLEQRLTDEETGSNYFNVVWNELTRWNWFLAIYSAQTNAFNAALDEKADRAWGYYESHSGEYAPDGYTWISSPKIAIAGGLAYQRTLTTAGAVWVLVSNGLVAQTDGVTSNGFFRIRDDEGNTTFEIVRGNKRTVGATAAGIEVANDGDNTIVTIPYNVVSEEHPTVYGTTDLSTGEWSALSATWLGQSGAWTAQVTSASATLFVKGEYLTGGETYIRNVAPISADAGIYCTDGVHKVRPVYSNGSITWEVVQ